ncbi:MAG: alcohol dehydrogenase catalytic domain-containing protein [Desulfobacterales bacterium]|nr:MAG: alcohol dehydrogenase catalytic domain-containing protein [Desulfobacterales bacterium]
MGKMKALVWQGPYKMKLTEVEKPKPRAGELLIKTKSVGVCGSDLEIYKGGFAHSVPPLILGHEACGVVEEVTEGVENIQVGERVAVDPGIFCGKCEFCRKGSYWQCDHRDILGMQKHNGAYAEYFVMPHLSCYSIPADMDWDEAALIDILADPLHAMNMMPLQIGETVAVFGPGPGGICFVQLAKTAGAAMVILIGTREERLALGRKLGADITININKKDVIDEIMRITHQRGVDVGIEASGSTQALPNTLSVTRKQGRVMVFGIYSENASLDMQDMHRRELTIFGSSGCPWSMPTAINLIANKKIEVKPMITHRVNLEGLEALFNDGIIEHRKEGYFKGVLLI